MDCYPDHRRTKVASEINAGSTTATLSCNSSCNVSYPSIFDCPVPRTQILTVLSYVQVTSGTLSLPLSTGTTVLTIILPIIAAANVFFTPLLHRFLQSRTRSLATQQLLPIALQVIQGILTVVLATLSAQGFVPGKLLECSLEGNWQRMYSAKDDQALQRIQDSFNCCGLRSTQDRDFPRNKQCLTTYPSRTISCLDPWRAAEQRTAGLGFAAIVVVGVLQVDIIRNQADLDSSY